MLPQMLPAPEPTEGTAEPATSWSALVVDDDPGVRQSVRLCLEADGGRVLGVGSTKAALEALDRGRFDVVLLDLWLGRDSGLSAIPQMLAARPGVGIIVITAYASFETAVEAMRLGAVDYLPKPFTPEQVRFATRRVVAAERMRRRVAELEERALAEGDDFFASESPRYRAFLAQMQRAAKADSVVLLRGESGSGKNVLARYLVSHGPRADRPFVTVRGGDGESFASKVDEAAGGTVYVDEVGELSEAAQARLVAWLADQGDVRLIASTNRPLEDEVRAGRFREDLLYRLDVVPLTLPPLRERAEDIPDLAAGIVRRLSRRLGIEAPTITPEALSVLQDFPFPGNVRELENVLERALALCNHGRIDVADLQLRAVPRADNAPPLSPERISQLRGQPPATTMPALGDQLEDVERAAIIKALEAARYNKTAAAKALGMTFRALRYRIKKLGIE